MKSISEYTSDKRIKELAKDPVKKLIDEIHKRVNEQRVRDGYKPLAWIVYKSMTKHLTQQDLDYLLKRMSQSRSASKVFFGALKVK